MTPSNNDIVSVIKNGENTFVEFKEKDVRAESVAKELVAFLNFEGGTLYKPSQQELIRLLQESNQLHYEIIPILNTSIKDISKGRLQDYFEKRGIDIEQYNPSELENFLYNTEILVEVNEIKYISLTGILFFAKNTDRWVKNSGVQLVRFDGNEITDPIIDRKDIEGNLPEIIDKAVDFVNLYNRVAEKFVGIKRIDLYDYNRKVIRELIVNAFAHRDWSLEGAKIRVYVFNDFIEVRSPGKIPNTLTLDRIKAGISYYRNPLIMQMLVDYGYADKIGRGIMSIIKYHRDNDLKAPDFEECGFEFRVRIWKQ